MKQQEGKEDGWLAAAPASKRPQTSVHQRGNRRPKVIADRVSEVAAASPEQERKKAQPPAKSVFRTRNKSNPPVAKSSPAKKSKEGPETRRPKRKPSTELPTKRQSRQTKVSGKVSRLFIYNTEFTNL